LLTDLGGESTGKELQRVKAYTPNKSQKERSQNYHTKNHQEKAPKITTKEKWEQHHKT
jgi:hypothetical protein